MFRQSQFIGIVFTVALAALGITGCDEEEVKTPEVRKIKADGRTLDVIPGPGGALMADGVRLKLVVSQDTTLRDQPRGTEVGPKVEMFNLLYVHDVRTLEDDTWFRVSRTPEEGSAISWIPNKMARVWRHRVGFRPIALPDSRVLRLPIYETAEDASEAMQGSVSAKPIAIFDLVVEDDKGQIPCNPWPILEKRLITVNGKQRQIYRVAMLGKKAGAGNPAKPRYEESELDRFRAQLQDLDFMVCMDGTGSMTSWMKSTKEAVAAFSRSIGAMDCKPNVSALLTIYRDDSDGDDIVNHYGPGTIDQFCSAIGSVEASGGDADKPEAGLEGLMRCLNQMDYRPRSHRVILLIGDTPHHLEEGPSNPEGYTLADIVKEAIEKHITIFSLSVGSDWPERDRQFRILAEGTGGRLLSIDNINELTVEIRKLLSNEAASMGEMHSVFDGVLNGKSEDEIASTMGRSLEQISYIVDVLRTTKNIDMDRVGPRGCLVLEGWIAPVCGSARAGQLEVLCFKSEANKVLDVLRDLLKMEPGVGFGGTLWDAASGSRSNATISEKFAEMILPHRGTSILSYTKAELDGLPQERRVILQDRTYEFIKALGEVYTDNRRWYRQTSNQIIGWVPETCFP